MQCQSTATALSQDSILARPSHQSPCCPTGKCPLPEAAYALHWKVSSTWTARVSCWRACCHACSGPQQAHAHAPRHLRQDPLTESFWLALPPHQLLEAHWAAVRLLEAQLVLNAALVILWRECLDTCSGAKASLRAEGGWASPRLVPAHQPALFGALCPAPLPCAWWRALGRGSPT